MKPRLAGLIFPLLLAGCSGIQSTLDPAADQAGQIHIVWNMMLVICGVMYLLVIGFLAFAIWRSRRTLAQAADAPPETVSRDEPVKRSLALWAGLIVAGIFTLTITSFLIDRTLAETGPKPLKIKVTAKQWWWQVEYQNDADPSQTLTTANELHLPVNRSAMVELQAQDVIHSFWVPNLHGKEDLIPGRTNDIILTPRRIGRFRGQCAEFCGLQHAHMAFDVVVHSPQDFEAWRQAQLKTAFEPTNTLALEGKQLFYSRPCVMCHQILGTEAGSRAGPDLTHVASRQTIAAGTLPYSRQNLALWIRNPQGLKPGANMPAVPLSQHELNAIVAYLDTLK